MTHVVDTSGAYIPGHGTPTVIIFGRHRAPVTDVVRTVMGIKGEPGIPEDPTMGQVWSSILLQIDRAGSESDFVSVADNDRAVFGKHPWSIGGGGATDLKEDLEADRTRLEQITVELGISSVNGEDELFLLADQAHAKRIGLEHIRPMVTGDLVRDWFATSTPAAWIYDDDFKLLRLDDLPRTAHYFWPAYAVISKRKRFGTPMVERGFTWYEYQELYVNKLRTPLTITFPFIATHNHFVLDRGGKIFNRTAPVIKLPATVTEDEHLGLIGLLNSSVGCFWLKQECFTKDGRGEPWEQRKEFNASNVAAFPLCAQRPIDLATAIDTLALQIAKNLPSALLMNVNSNNQLPTRANLDVALATTTTSRRKLIALQEELDWRCYRLYDLLSDTSVLEYSTPPEIAFGERAFEIVLARRMAKGIDTSAWFERHSSTPVTHIPSHWPEDYRRVVQSRIDLIESDRNIGLIERPEYKRRWSSLHWDTLEQTALRNWLLDRLELPRYWASNADQPPQLTSTSRLADAVRMDTDFMQMAALYAGHADFDPSQLVAQLVTSESVPFLPVQRLTDAGLRKLDQWKDIWKLQRRMDSGEDVGNLPLPPKYKSTDFLKTDVWRLRGGLDVPKERWISYPGCERGADGSLVIAWAGWDHLQQATAIASYYLDMKDSEGWPPERLQPLLAGLLELVPWLEQWHNDVDPIYGERMGHYYKGFVSEEARAQGFTLDDLKAWKPAVVAATRGRRKATP